MGILAIAHSSQVITFLTDAQLWLLLHIISIESVSNWKSSKSTDWLDSGLYTWRRPATSSISAFHLKAEYPPELNFTAEEIEAVLVLEGIRGEWRLS